jgi:ribosome maturation factor RimP
MQRSAQNGGFPLKLRQKITWLFLAMWHCFITFATANEYKKGTEFVPFCFSMIREENIKLIENQILTLISESPDLFLVALKTDVKNNIRVFLDGDKGISIQSCTTVNRGLYKFIEENELVANNDFSLEVSSPGLDEPLLLHRQYVKNLERPLEVLLTDGIKVEGVLKAVTETGFTLEETKGKGKKQEILQHTLAFDAVKSAVIKIVF